MSSNLSRLFSSVPTHSAPNLAIPSLIRITSDSLNRFISSSIQQPTRSEHVFAVEDVRESGKESTPNETEDAGKEDQDDEDGIDINEATGEVGGPKGPEPTRYGDWERNGRCSDF